MTFRATICHTTGGAEGEMHWCDTEEIEAADLEEARAKLVINETADELADLRPLH